MRTLVLVIILGVIACIYFLVGGNRGDQKEDYESVGITKRTAFLNKDKPKKKEERAKPNTPKLNIKKEIKNEGYKGEKPIEKNIKLLSQDEEYLLKSMAGNLISDNIPFDEKEKLWKELVDKGMLETFIKKIKEGEYDWLNESNRYVLLGDAYRVLMNTIKDPGKKMEVADMAKDFFMRAEDLRGGDWRIKYSKANLYYNWPGKNLFLPEAERELREVIDKNAGALNDGNFANTYILLGRIYEKMGDKDEAQRIWREGINRFPENKTLQKLAEER